jgi:hypothetical protein
MHQAVIAFEHAAVHLQDARSHSERIAPDQWSVYRSLDEAMVLTHRSPSSIGYSEHKALITRSSPEGSNGNQFEIKHSATDA